MKQLVGVVAMAIGLLISGPQLAIAETILERAT